MYPSFLIVTLSDNTGVCRFLMKKRPTQTKQRTVCADPDKPWVQYLISVVDQRTAEQN